MTMRGLQIRGLIAAGLFFSALTAFGQDADKQVFSGPQVGEKLPPMKLVGVLPKPKGENGKEAKEGEGKDFDPVAQADGKPVLLMFLHKKTRPAFGLMNAVARYSTTRQKDGLSTHIIALTDDPPETKKWLTQIARYFPKDVQVSYSPNGLDGPGAYGLNRRNVELTVLVGNAGKVTANFALTQPSDRVDGPKILKAVVDVLGGGEVPQIPAAGNRRQRANGRRMDPQMDSRLAHQIITNALKELSSDDAKPDAVIAELKRQMKDVQAVRLTFPATLRRFLQKNTLPEETVAKLKELAATPAKPTRNSGDLISLFRPLIQKDATPEQVEERAKKILDYIKDKPAAQQEVGRMTSRVVDSGRLNNYGTPAARKFLTDWAKKYGPKTERKK